MSDTGARFAAYGDLLSLPEDARAEIIGGQIVAMPERLPRRSNAQGALRRFVGGPLHDDDGHGGRVSPCGPGGALAVLW